MPAMFISTAPGMKRKYISIRLNTRQISVKKTMSAMAVSTGNNKIAFFSSETKNYLLLQQDLDRSITTNS